MKYSVDTNTIITAIHEYYPPDIFGGVWDRIDELIDRDEFVSVEDVYHELVRKADPPVASWVKTRKAIFKPLDIPIQIEVQEILGAYPRLVDNRRGRHGADPWVIALAKVYGLTVVTYETVGTPSKPKIPDICQALSVPCTNLIGLMREERWNFPR